MCEHNLDKLQFGQLMFLLKFQWRRWQKLIFTTNPDDSGPYVGGLSARSLEDYVDASPGQQVNYDISFRIEM